ncbi:MAG: carboxypeptidase regulatory-like domain-containing protein [Vicinamibacterales bacterium]
MTGVFRATLAAGLVLLGTPTWAQMDQGRLQGLVTDAQQGVLPGVTVTARAPSLIGTQTAVTEGDGRYRFPSLPPGRYTLTFELAGFQTVLREGIGLALGQTLNVDLSMQVATLQETVTVSGDAPIVDVSSTKVGSEFSAEALAAVPSATDIWAALSQSPGVRMLGFDVGGSHKSQQIGYESFGVRNQNRVVTDGVDTTEGTGGAGIYQDFFAHEEISVSAAGGDVSMMTPGSAVFSSIKSGGNTYKSLNNVTWEDESFVGDNLDDDNRRRGDTGQPNLQFWEVHTDIGGPIVRDRAWFYGAYNHFKIDKAISGVSRDFTDLGEFDNATGKVTAKFGSRDTVAAYYQWGRKSKPLRGLSNTIGPDSILAQDSRSWMYNGQHQRVWTNRAFTDVKVGLFGFGWPMAPQVPFESNPPREDTGTGVQTGAGWLAGNAGGPFTFDRNKPQVTATLTYFLPSTAGSHDFKAGFEWQDDQSKFANNGTSGPILYRDLNGAVDLVRISDVGTASSFGADWTGADDRNERYTVFLQDKWSLSNRVTLTIGVRFDRQRPHFEDSVRNPVVSSVFAPVTVTGRTLLTSNTTVPRIGISVTPDAAGRSVVKAFYGRYYFNFADRLANVNPGGTNTRDYRFNDLNGNRLFDGPQELGALVASAGGSSTTLDPDLDTPYTDEVSVSYERQFWGESSVRLAYVRKMTRREFATFNEAREGQFTVARTVTIAEADFVNGTTGSRSLTLFDIPDALRGQVRNVVANIPESVGGGDYNYDTVQFAFNKRFGSGLFVQSSFDYQWRDELRQNVASTSPLNSDPLGIDFFQNVFPDVSNRQESTNWQGRVLGRYEFPLQVGLAANFRAQSGWQYARLLRVALPNAGTQTFFAEDIDNNRSDTIALVDLRVDKRIRFGGRYSVSLMADLFNALNSNAVSNFNLLNGTQFNRIIASIDPRTLMLGARFEF